MSEKFLNSRIINKHDLEVNWNKAVNFIPKAGELIVYDIDSTYSYERFKIGDKIKVMVKSFDKSTGKIVLTHKELLGTWEDNIKDFQEGTTVIGIARAREKNGIFVELRPNLVGLADHRPGVEYGQRVSVFIKKIIPEKKKIKLVIVG